LKWISENNEDEKEESELMLKKNLLEMERLNNLEKQFAEKAEVIFSQEDTPYTLYKMYRLCLMYEPESAQMFQKEIPTICPFCQNCLETKNGVYVCSKCAYHEQKMEKAIPKSSNKNEKTQYDPKDNFRSIVLTFQGKKSKKIPESVYKTIENSFIKYHIDSPQTMKKETLIFILQENKLSDYYEDINVIYENYTGIKPPDLSYFEESIFKRNSLVEEVFEQIKNDERQNSLNNFFKLYAFLSMEGFNCKCEEFPVLKTRNVVVYHNRTMNKICEELKKHYPDMNWKFKPYC